MEDALRERAKILEDLLPSIFKSIDEPSEKTLKLIMVHMALAETPSKIMNPKAIRPKPNDLIEKYSGTLDVVNVADNRPKICPLSQSAITKEWKGPCGHIFEDSAIQEYLKRSNKCPVIGCTAKLLSRR